MTFPPRQTSEQTPGENGASPPPPPIGIGQNRTPFLATLYILFFRPSLVFGVLERETLPRTLFRVFGMAIACALFLTLIDIPRTNQAVDEWADWLAGEMRDVEWVDGRLSWTPAQPLPYSRPFNGWRVTFVGDPDVRFDRDERYGPEDRGIWISPVAVHYWQRLQKGRVVARQVLDAGKVLGAFSMKGDGGETNGDVAISFDGRNRSLVRLAAVAMGGLSSLATVVGEVLFYAALFTLIPLFLRSPQARMGVKKLLIFHLHLALVPLLVATVYATTRIPFLKFNTVFAIGYLVYFSFVVIVARQTLRALQNKDGRS